MTKISRPRTRRELWSFIYVHFGLALPHKTFTPGHSSPFDFVADAFFHPARDMAAWASRSGGKTLSASIIAALEFLFTDKLQARVLSGSEDQARNLYNYWRRWCVTLLAGRLDESVKASRTRVAGGSLEILAASQKDVRGPKVHRLFEDELDEIDCDIDAAAVGMIASDDLHPGRTVYASTWHRNDGRMAWLIDQCGRDTVALHKWNLWESIERCPSDRHEQGRGCKTCGLAPACLAKAREALDEADGVGIASAGCGFYRIDDAVKAYRKVGKRVWETEYECRRPGVEGLVYPQFDETDHRCKTPPPGLRVYRSIDWGHGVFVCLWLGQDRQGCVWLLDTYRAECGTIHQHAEHISSHRLTKVAETYCDPAGRNRNDQTGRSNVDIFREYGIHCSYTLDAKLREVRNGIRLVRGALEPAAGRAKFFYVACENNRIFVKAMQSYRNRKVNGIWLDEPADPQEFEHIPDALRYFFVNRQPAPALRVVQLAAW